MKITYIVGNGLDISYGLKTQYKAFYEYQKAIYQNKKDNEEYSNYIYEALFKDEQNQYENWADFELAIGTLTKGNPLITQSEENKTQFIDDFLDVIDDLIDYLNQIESEFFEQEGFSNLFINFEDTFKKLKEDLTIRDRESITEYFEKFVQTTDEIRILTYNYTSVLDKLYENSSKYYEPPYRYTGNSNLSVYPPIHAHGTLSENVILGVSDVSQLSEKFTQEELEYFLKLSILRDSRENMDVRNDEIINSSDLIIIYGMSFGKTDQYLWEKIAQQSLSKDMPIILHQYHPNLNRGNNQRLKREYQKVENLFITRSGVSDEEKETLRDNLMIVLDKEIFALASKN